MNEKAARIKGLEFTGHCDWRKSTLVPKVEELRKKGFKAHIVTKPADPLSRGSHGPSYSIYACRKWHLTEDIERMQARVDRQDGERSAMLERHRFELEVLTNQHLTIVVALERNKQELVELSAK